jgi:quercetin dioxygenase-like cupin family protein/GNAT superfamily N-acetyltransferase
VSAPRRATPDELPALARLWEAGWHDAHDGLVPPALVALRTSDSFLDRLSGFGDALRVAGPPGEPLGLCVASGEEIDQLYVAPAARGTGLAATLLADGEARLAAAGASVGRIACAIGNDRALRFYEKHGWRGGRETTTIAGSFELEVILLRKRLPATEDATMRHTIDMLPEHEVFPGFHGRFVHSASMTFAWWTIDAGAAVPEHAHPHEQVVNVLDGELALTVDGTEHRLFPGDVVAIPGGVRHAARALAPCRVLDVFSPVRDDYRFPA